ncbi:MAG: hypothetical protein IKU27_06580 [Clostridia bacterium]|nr:hypothetical protein [Clostridia bacterium]
MNNSINYLWNHGTEENWLEALKQYDVIIDSRSVEAWLIEDFMEKLDAEDIKNMSVEEFYNFLYEKYFVWVFTQKNRLASTRKHLQRYVDENRMIELENIQKKLFSTNHSNIKECLKIAMDIRGLGIAGASGLLAVLFPNDFGTVNEPLVEILRGIDGIQHADELLAMKPSTANDGVVVIKLFREKAEELNKKFNTGFWTPRKIDKVLWACTR